MITSERLEWVREFEDVEQPFHVGFSSRGVAAHVFVGAHVVALTRADDGVVTLTIGAGGTNQPVESIAAGLALAREVVARGAWLLEVPGGWQAVTLTWPPRTAAADTPERALALVTR